MNNVKELTRNPLEEAGIFLSRYPAQVTDNQDPEKAFRLRVSCPAVADKPLDWALPCGVFLGNGYGFFALPQKGDSVWVSFQGGDMSKPIWEYGAVVKGAKPDAVQGSTLTLASKSGVQVVLHSSGKVEIKNGTVSLGDTLQDLVEWLKTAKTLDNMGGIGTFDAPSLASLEIVIQKFQALFE